VKNFSQPNSFNFIDIPSRISDINMSCMNEFSNYAEIAQLVEQWIEDPRVSSSNLDLGILVI
jgi:hypothetical protein